MLRLLKENFDSCAIPDHAVDQMRRRCKVDAYVDNRRIRGMIADTVADSSAHLDPVEGGKEESERHDFIAVLEAKPLIGMREDAYILVKEDKVYGQVWAAVTVITRKMYEELKIMRTNELSNNEAFAELKTIDGNKHHIITLEKGLAEDCEYILVATSPEGHMFSINGLNGREAVEDEIEKLMNNGVKMEELHLFERKKLKKKVTF